MDKLAVRYTSTDANGKKTMKYVDANSGKEIQDTNGYQVIDNYDTDPTSGKQPTDAANPYDVGNVSEDKGFLPKPEGNGDAMRYLEGSQGRSMSNNFGYANKPDWLGAAAMMPVPFLGAAAKAVDFGVSVNNRAAVRDARESIGLQPGLGLGGFVQDPKGYVADVNIGDNAYAVGLEGLDRSGRTTLTPNEARTRGMLAGGLTEATGEQKRQNVKDFKTDKTAIHEQVPASQAGIPDTSVQRGDDEGDTLAHGLGLFDLSPSFKNKVQNGVNYEHPDRGPVTQGLTERSVDAMDALATNTPGGVNVTSAYRSPELNKSIGGAKNSLHSQGSAFDLSTKGLSDKEKRDLVERSVMSGAMEIGTYPDQSLHIGTVQRNAPIDPNTGEPQPTGGVAAMYDRTRSLYDNAPSWFHSGLEESQLAPTPTERPEQPSAMIAEQDEPKAPESLGLMDKAPTGGANTKTLDPNRFKDITDEDRNLMGMTLAGEIDPSKTDLTTEDGRKEAMGILSTVENRMGKYGSIKDTITAPKQYSTWNNDAAANTATKNYYANKDVYDKFVNDYVADPQQNLGFTSYHANTVNPGWSSAMSSPETIGPHTFGFLSEYAPKSTGPVTPTTVFNTQAMSAPKVSGVMSDENANRTSSLSVANKPASNNNSTSPSSNSSGTGFSSSPGGSGGTGTKTTGITAGGGWGQKSSSDDDSGTTNGGRSGYSGSRSDGW